MVANRTKQLYSNLAMKQLMLLDAIVGVWVLNLGIDQCNRHHPSLRRRYCLSNFDRIFRLKGLGDCIIRTRNQKISFCYDYFISNQKSPVVELEVNLN